MKCERARILRRLATNCKVKAERRNTYLEALTLLNSTIRLCDELMTEITSLCSPEEVGCSLFSVSSLSSCVAT